MRTDLQGTCPLIQPNTSEADGSPCMVPQVTSFTEEVSALALCNLVPHILDEGAKRLDQLGSIGMKKVVLGKLLHQRSPMRRDWKMSPCMRMMGRMQMRRVKAVQVAAKKALTLPAATLTGATTLIAGLSGVNQGAGRMVPLGVSEGEGESKAGHPPTLTSSELCEQESSSESMEAAPEETTSTVGDLPPTGSQNAVIIYATED